MPITCSGGSSLYLRRTHIAKHFVFSRLRVGTFFYDSRVVIPVLGGTAQRLARALPAALAALRGIGGHVVAAAACVSHQRCLHRSLERNEADATRLEILLVKRYNCSVTCSLSACQRCGQSTCSARVDVVRFVYGSNKARNGAWGCNGRHHFRRRVMPRHTSTGLLCCVPACLL